jgi:phosphoglycerate kinase
MKQTVKDLDVAHKKVLVRVDFNVPLKNGGISDDNRIVQALPTIQYLIDHKAKVILFSHLGKVKSDDDKKYLSLEVVAERLSELLDHKVIFVGETQGPKLEKAIEKMHDGNVLLMENTRFEKGETKNDPKLAKYWASLADFYVNDAFGSGHRAHASMVGVPEHLDSAVGFLIEKELAFIGETIDKPKHPFIVILGGAKVSDKIMVIDNLLPKADRILIGGGMAYTFIKAQGYEVGTSLVEEDKVALAKEYLQKAGDKIVIPVDSICADKFSEDAQTREVLSTAMPPHLMGLDIGVRTIELYKEILDEAQTVLWNGPVGVFEMKKFANGTRAICEILANIPATTIIGGGDSAAAAKQLGYADKFDHISTGGGASLAFMEGQPLPAIEVIKDKEQA